MTVPPPSKLIQASQVIRCVMSSTSLLGSSTIAYMILNSPRGGLQSPYSRIIFGMSIADIMQSQGFLISPFVNVAEDAIWNVNGGNEKVCEAVGSIFTIGSVAGPLYTFFLIYYFLQRVMYKVKPTDFCKQKKEAWIHMLIWLYPFVFTCYALFKKQMNSSRYGSLCMIVPKPFGCWLDNSCERGEDAVITLLLSTNIPLILVFVGIVLLLTILTIYVYKQERLFAPTSKRQLTKNCTKPSDASSTIRTVSKNIILAAAKDEGKAGDEKVDHEKEVSSPQPESVLMSDIHFEISPIVEEEEECKEEVDEEEAGPAQQPMYEVIATNSNQSSADQPEKAVSNGTKRARQDVLKRHQFLVTKQSFHQSALYILAFFLTYFVPVLDIFLALFKLRPWKGTFLLVSLFLPSIGLFNIFIYTRPKVMLMKKKYPHFSWIERFLSVILSGGEIPIAMDNPELSKPKSSSVSHYAQIVVNDSRMISSNIHNNNFLPVGLPQDSQGVFDTGRFNLSSLEDNSGEENEYNDVTGVTFPIGL